MVIPNDHIRELDHLFDEDPVDVKKIDGTMMKLTRGADDAIRRQRVEGLTLYMAGLNFVLNEINWRCDENPTNVNYFYVKGRLVQLIDGIDMADDTALSERVIDTVIGNPLYLKVLQVLEAAQDHVTRIGNVFTTGEELKSILHWMEPHQLIEHVTDATITYGSKGQRTLQAVLEKMRQGEQPAT